VSIKVFQTFDQSISGTLTSGTRWNVLTVQDPKLVWEGKVWEPLFHDIIGRSHDPI